MITTFKRLYTSRHYPSTIYTNGVKEYGGDFLKIKIILGRYRIFFLYDILM